MIEVHLHSWFDAFRPLFVGIRLNECLFLCSFFIVSLVDRLNLMNEKQANKQKW